MDKLAEQIARARAAGYKDPEIQAELTRRGMGADVIARALQPAGEAPVDPLASQRGTRGYGMEAFNAAAQEAAAQGTPADLGRSTLMGATLNTAGLVAPQLATQQAAYREKHPGTAAAFEGVGGLLTGLGTAGLVGKIPALALPFLTGAEGAVAGAAGAESGDRIAGAIKGGGIGAVLGALPGLIKGGAALSETIADIRNPARVAAREAAGQLPSGVPTGTGENASTISPAAALARQEQLAPGSAQPAALSDQMGKLVRNIGADPAASAASIQQTETAHAAVGEGIKKVRAGYQALEEHPSYGQIEVSPRLDAILRRARPDFTGETISLSELQDIRQRVGAKLSKTVSPADFKTLKETQDALNDYLNWRVPPLAQLDKDYAFLKAAQERSEKLLDVLKGTGSSHAANRVAGVEAATPGGSITDKTSAFQWIKNFLTKPDPAKAARATAQMLIPPTPMLPPAIAAAQASQAPAAAAVFNPASHPASSLLDQIAAMGLTPATLNSWGLLSH